MKDRRIHVVVAVVTTVMLFGGAFAADPPDLYTAGYGYDANDPTTFTTYFPWHWDETNNLEATCGPWTPLGGVESWDGSLTYHKDQIKQIMMAGIDQVHLVMADGFDPPDVRANRKRYFQVMAELRAEGYDVPKVAPWMDTIGTIYTSDPFDLATTEGKDRFANAYIDFFNDYFDENTDEHAADYLVQTDGKITLNCWRFDDARRVKNPGSLTRSDVETRISAALSDIDDAFDEVYYIHGSTWPNPPSWTDEKVPQYDSITASKTTSYNGITTGHVMPGYWDETFRQEDAYGYIARDGGTTYRNAWTTLLDNNNVSRIHIESWNEYNEGTGIYAGDPNNSPYYGIADPNNTMWYDPNYNYDNSGDTWSNSDDPYEYIKTTAEATAVFTEFSDEDADILWHDLPEVMAPNQTQTITVVVRNEGDVSWTGAAGYAFDEKSGGTDFDTTRQTISDSSNEIGTYGGIFRGRPITYTFDITAPSTTGEHSTSWQMVQVGEEEPDADANTFNWYQNTAGSPTGEQSPGLVNYLDSSALQTNDSIADMFGAIGGVEGTTTIFADGGVQDNGNQVIGDANETVDYVTFETSQNVTIWGYAITLAGDGRVHAERGTELVEFSVEDSVVDFWDNDGRSYLDDQSNPLPVVRLFDESVTGDEFELRLTRSHDEGPRIFEIDAILTEPSGTEVLDWFGDTLNWTFSIADKGDIDLDGDIDNIDFGALYGTFTGPGIPTGYEGTDNSNRADLIYDPNDGNVVVDASEAEGGVITSYALQNLWGLMEPNEATLYAFPNSTDTTTAYQISQTDYNQTGFSSTLDLGDILPADMDLAELEEFFLNYSYCGTVGTGYWEFDLLVKCDDPQTWADGDFDGDGDVDNVDLGALYGNYTGPAAGGLGPPIPEPATLALLTMGGPLLLRNRKRRKG